MKNTDAILGGVKTGELNIIYQDKENNIREWKRAQFQQQEDKVFYTFRNSPTTKLRGYIPLDHIIAIEEDSADGSSRFNIIVPGKTVELKSDSQKDRKRWIQFFTDYVNNANSDPSSDVLNKTFDVPKRRSMIFKTVRVDIEERENLRKMEKEERQRQKEQIEKELLKNKTKEEAERYAQDKAEKRVKKKSLKALDLKAHSGWIVIPSTQRGGEEGSSSGSISPKDPSSPPTQRRASKFQLGHSRAGLKGSEERQRNIEALLSPRTVHMKQSKEVRKSKTFSQIPSQSSDAHTAWKAGGLRSTSQRSLMLKHNRVTKEPTSPSSPSARTIASLTRVKSEAGMGKKKKVTNVTSSNSNSSSSSGGGKINGKNKSKGKEKVEVYIKPTKISKNV